MIRLGRTWPRRSPLMDYLLSRYLESDGIQRLDAIAKRLDPAQCRALAIALEAIEKHREPLEAVMERDLMWLSHPFPWRGAVFYRVLSPMDDLPERMVNCYRYYREDQYRMLSLISTLRVLGGAQGRRRWE
jgi:hypothetical protein